MYLYVWLSNSHYGVRWQIKNYMQKYVYQVLNTTSDIMQTMKLWRGTDQALLRRLMSQNQTCSFLPPDNLQIDEMQETLRGRSKVWCTYLIFFRNKRTYTFLEIYHYWVDAAGLKTSTYTLVFTSKIQGRASQFFVMLVQPGMWYFKSK